MACPYTAAKKVVSEDLPSAVVAVGLESFARHMEWEVAQTILGGTIVGLSTFMAVKGKTANAVKKEKYGSEKLYLHLGILSVATLAGLYAGGLFLKSNKKK